MIRSDEFSIRPSLKIDPDEIVQLITRSDRRSKTLTMKLKIPHATERALPHAVFQKSIMGRLREAERSGPIGF
jgi:hypothetical protein